ncbi:DUF4158 domain-containing protein [Streptomyces sp. T028]|uniref:DUF4158 domain-containing protein n=1 Tax=Streptomyces sp. T028 TaxID=3394379 RepID=UPI003A8439EC
MRQDWEPEYLIEVWTLLEDDMKRVRNKSGATRLGFALLLKFFEVEARFPESAKEVPAAAVEYVAQQVRRRLISMAWTACGKSRPGRTVQTFRPRISRRQCLAPVVRACSGICFQGRHRSCLCSFFWLPFTTRR